VSAVPGERLKAQWMQAALALAAQAAQAGEVPIGALVVLDNRIVGRGFNQTRQLHDPSAHAEILAMRSACATLGNERLVGATLICTLEPCVMCVGALLHARIAHLVYGANEPKTGACGSAFDLLSEPAHQHQPTLEKGVLAAESAQLLRQFFAQRR
jgi:tRNA(adenine34) deaminase